MGLRETRRDGAFHNEKLEIREFSVRVNIPSPIQHVQVLIRCVITPIEGLPNPIRQVVPLISHIRSYPPHCSHLHPPSLSIFSTTLISSQNTKLSYPSLSLYGIIMSGHRVQHTPSTAYTEYSIHRVQHTPSTAYTEYSIHRVRHTPSTAYTEYSIHRVQHLLKILSFPLILMITGWPLKVASGVTPYTINCHQPARYENLKMKSLCHIPKFASQLMYE